MDAPSDGRTPAEILAEAASFYWEVAELDLDEVDPDDHVAVLRKAFTESDCNDFAWMLHAMTGWPMVRASYQLSKMDTGHHTMVRAPDGRLLDVRGYASEAQMARRCYGMKGALVTFAETEPGRPLALDEIDEDGFSEGLQRLAGIIRSLPGRPFQSQDFREMSLRPVEGVDVPMQGPDAAPGP